MRSDAVKKGMQQAPHRSLFNALGLTEEEMNRPLVGTGTYESGQNRSGSEDGSCHGRRNSDYVPGHCCM